MHPSTYAPRTPDKPALIMDGSGEVVTYRQLDERSNQGAQLFRALGLGVGDVIAILMENSPRFFEITWAAQRAGLYYTCISSKLTASEVEYIVRDCGARLLIVSPGVGSVLDELPALLPDMKLYMTTPVRAPYADFEGLRGAMPATPVADETAGSDMLYSSGTTGRPKGVKPALSGGPIDAPERVGELARVHFGFSEDTVYLCPAPFYHAAAVRWVMAVHRQGGTAVAMSRFDAEAALALIEAHSINTAQFVPTHFVRMLKLPEAVRRAHDTASLKVVFHSAAPCPLPIKEQMLDWLGPIIGEYYGGTEGIVFCRLTAEEWLAHKGSVGRAVAGELRICDEDGEPLPPRREGVVHVANGPPIRYHNAPEKAEENTNKYGWPTMGDVGWVDEDGYLYLTDRKSFMIISGGVNIYPQELENLLITHPKVADAAVVGAPDAEMGEQVVAVIQPLDWANAGEALRDELMAFCRENISHVKCPRLIDFVAELPRHQTGKLYKRLIRDAYWGKEGSKIV